MSVRTESDNENSTIVGLLNRLVQNLLVFNCLNLGDQIMKRFIFLLFVAGVYFTQLTSCTSTESLLRNKEYDDATARLASKISKPNPNPEHIKQFSELYSASNQADHDRIQQLKLSGLPDIWVEIAGRYAEMSKRYEIAEQLPDTVKKMIQFKEIDFQQPLAGARLKARRYVHAKVNDLVTVGNDSAIRDAYTMLLQLKNVDPESVETESLMREVLFSGIQKASVHIINRSGIDFTPPWLSQLVTMNDSRFIVDPISGKKSDGSSQNDLQIIVILESVKVSAEKIEKRSYTERAYLVGDGLKIVPVLSDSILKTIPKNALLEARINEVIRSRNCVINANVEIIRTKGFSASLVNPVEAMSEFKNAYANVNGDVRALSAENVTLMKQHEVPFPPEEALVNDAAKEFNRLLNAIFVKNNVVSDKN